MIDGDAVLGVLVALVRAVEATKRVDGPPSHVDVCAYRDRIVALAEDVGICGAIVPFTGPQYRALQCDLTDGHRGLHSGLDWSGLRPDEIGTPRRMHWSSLSGAERRTQ